MIETEFRQLMPPRVRERWEIELVYDEQKTHQDPPRPTKPARTAYGRDLQGGRERSYGGVDSVRRARGVMVKDALTQGDTGRSLDGGATVCCP